MEPHQQTTYKPVPRRNRLFKIEEQAKEIWTNFKFNEAEPHPDLKKFFVTYPFPHVISPLYLPQGFSITKADFIARYMKLKGYNVLWPFGFDCTGNFVPNNVKRLQAELEIVNSKQIDLSNADLGNNDMDGDEIQGVRLPHCFALLRRGVSSGEIKEFTNVYYWSSYFSQLAKKDLGRLGVMCDFRRSFITTEKNPYYDSFIKWQFTHLKEKQKLVFSHRPCIVSTLDNKPCVHFERRDGEGVKPQEYTIIKLRLAEIPEKMKVLEGKAVFLVVATLRPEVMYGITNCYVLPTGKYGAYVMRNQEIFICSERSAWNMAYQGLMKEYAKLDCVLKIEGADLLGLKVKTVSCACYEEVYVLPLLSINMEKCTGIHASVPSNSVEDWVNLLELQIHADLREKYGVKEDWVFSFQPVLIIEVPGYSNLCAIRACKDFNVNGPADRNNLTQAHEFLLVREFNEGIITIGNYHGWKVKEARSLIRKDMIEAGEAFVYYEPERKVVSRSGDVCVVTYFDEWHLKYGEDEWKKSILDYVRSPSFNFYSPALQKSLEDSIHWLREWNALRRDGLGTRPNFAPDFVIEPLSDSTIETAYYTIAHLLQGDLEGSTPGKLGIKYQDLTREVWDYFFLNTPYQPCPVSEELLRKARDEFRYWYATDLKIFDKSLIGNHSVMSLYNHAAIWEDKNTWPRAYFSHGLLHINGERMSRARRNVLSIDDAVNRYGADATRVAFADGGDSLDDGNFLETTANSAVLKLTTLEAWIKSTLETFSTLRECLPDESLELADKAFLNEMNRCIYLVEKSFEALKYRDVLKYGFYEMMTAKDDYVFNCRNHPLKKDLVLKYLEAQLLVLYPICPHFAEVIYHEDLKPFLSGDKPEFISMAAWPCINQGDINYSVIRMKQYVKDLYRLMRAAVEKATAKSKKDKVHPKKARILITSQYHDWQRKVIEVLNECEITPDNRIVDDWKKIIRDNFNLDKEVLKKSLQFCAYMVEELKEQGKNAIALEPPFIEGNLVKSNIENLKKEFNLEEIEIIEAKEALNSSEKNLANTASCCLPGRPQIICEKEI